ncbi:MAG TPA: YiaA/YiaB family inner membrane protein [Pseudobacillus sp.]
MQKYRRRNTTAFTVLAYFTLFAGVFLFSIGLYNADMQLNEKGYYIAVMILVAVGAILTQKVTRDNAEDNEIIAEQERERQQSISISSKKID